MSVDPGKDGGLAFWEPSGYTWAERMPQTPGEILSAIRNFAGNCINQSAEMVCYMEVVGGFIKGNAAPGSAMFKFGEGVGFIKGVIQTLGINLRMVRPQKWQQPFGLGTKSQCASKTIWKRKLCAEAERRFPSVNVTLKTCDALLILAWARQYDNP